MSYTFLQEQGEESSAACFSDISQSVRLKLSLTAEKSSCNDNETESCRGSQSGTMCEPSMESRGGELQTLCVVDSPARTLVLAGRVLALKESVQGFGRKCAVLLAKYDHGSCLWKTAQCLLFGGLELYSEAWPKWGLMQDGACWGLTIPADRTSEKEFGYLDSTPTKVMPLESNLTQDRIRILQSGRPRKMSKKGTDGSMNWAQLMLHKGFLPTAMLCEYYMGWPIGWTDLKPLEMGKYLLWRQAHGEF